MVDPQSVLLGALAIYILLLHMIIVYLRASLQYSKDTLNATEKDLTE
jgi:hypothetical protein